MLILNIYKKKHIEEKNNSNSDYNYSNYSGSKDYEYIEKTALQLAIDENNIEIIKLLLDNRNINFNFSIYRKKKTYLYH